MKNKQYILCSKTLEAWLLKAQEHAQWPVYVDMWLRLICGYEVDINTYCMVPQYNATACVSSDTAKARLRVII